MTETAGIAQFDEAPSAPRTPSPVPKGGVLRRAALVALILGSVLTLANQSSAVFGSENIQLLPLLLVYLTPFVVVTISQVLGARQAAADAGRGGTRGTAVESFASTVVGQFEIWRAESTKQTRLSAYRPKPVIVLDRPLSPRLAILRTNGDPSRHVWT